MMVPAIGHRSGDFKAVLRNLNKGLQYFFQTKGKVTIMTASASGGMEAAVTNLVRRDEKLVVLQNGKFGERFADIAKRHCPDKLQVVATPMGQPVDLVGLENALAKGDVKAVAAVVNESSAGVLNPGEKIAALCSKYGAYLIADCVTAMGGVDVPVDKWGIDIAIVGSQKCLGAPAGLAYVSCSDEAYAELKSPTLYLDLKAHFDKWAEEETPFTPATHLYLATQEALDILSEETLPKRIQRTAKMAQAFRAAAQGLNLQLLPDASISSPTITAVRNPATLTEAQLREPLRKEHGIVVAGGQGELKGKIMRVGHMGLAQPRELMTLVAALEDLLAKAQHPFKRGDAMAAASKLLV